MCRFSSRCCGCRGARNAGCGYMHNPGCRCASGTGNGSFYEYTEWVCFCNDPGYSSWFLTADARTVTLFVKNTGPCPITVCIQNSPNAADFTADAQRMELQGGEIGHLTPYIFSKYMRIAVTGHEHGEARIWVQMQRAGAVCAARHPQPGGHEAEIAGTASINRDVI